MNMYLSTVAGYIQSTKCRWFIPPIYGELGDGLLCCKQSRYNRLSQPWKAIVKLIALW